MNQWGGHLPQEPMFWHLDIFRTPAEAAAGKGARGIVLMAFERVWLSTIAGANWRPQGGTRVAQIGPLPEISNADYTAHYMETVTDPGHSTSIHRHDGPEIWYTLTGQLCLETADGMAIGHAGESTIALPRVPMRGTTIGSETRRSLVLVLHETSKPWFTPAPDWTPKGFCKP
jgi:quercetin dioxygenase-like cupin family protein